MRDVGGQKKESKGLKKREKNGGSKGKEREEWRKEDLRRDR